MSADHLNSIDFGSRGVKLKSKQSSYVLKSPPATLAATGFCHVTGDANAPAHRALIFASQQAKHLCQTLCPAFPALPCSICHDTLAGPYSNINSDVWQHSLMLPNIAIYIRFPALPYSNSL